VTFGARTFQVRDTWLLAQVGFLLFYLATMPHWKYRGEYYFRRTAGGRRGFSSPRH
jgi:hypothetical protein